MTDSSQKFISRNRAPRVQIEYDVELYGSEKKVQLPFVMGVMSDLAGKSTVTQPSIEERKFLEIDVDNFDDRMRGVQPRAAFSVPNTLTGDGNINVDLTFEKMDDFSPQAIAAKVAPLRSLLEARTQLSNLMTYMDGKVGAETLIEKILAEPALLSALAGSGQDAGESAAALDSLRALATEEPQQANVADSVLDGLKANAPVEDTPTDTSADVLAALAQTNAAEPEVADTKADVLASLRSSVPPDEHGEDAAQQAALDNLRAAQPAGSAPDTSADDALAGLAAAAPEETPEPDEVGAALDSLAEVETEAPADTSADDALAGLAAAAPEETPEPDEVGAALDSLAEVETEAPADTSADDALAGLAAAALHDPPQTDDVNSALDSLAKAHDESPVEDTAADTLAELAEAAPEEIPPENDLGDALDSLASIEIEDALDDGSAEALAGLANAQPEETPLADESDLALNSLDTSHAGETTPETPAESDLDDLLGDSGVDAQGAPDELDDLLGSAEGVSDLAPTAGNEPDDVLSASEAAGVAAEQDDLDDLLGDLDATGMAEVSASDPIADVPEPVSGDTADDPLGDLGGTEPDEPATRDTEARIGSGADGAISGGLDDLLGDLEISDAPDGATNDDEPPGGSGVDKNPSDDLDDLLGDLSEPDAPETTAAEAEKAPADSLDDVLADQEDSHAADSATQTDVPLGGSEVEESPSDDLDDLLGDLNEPDAPEIAAADTEAAPTDDLDDLLGDLNEPEASEPSAPVVDLDDLLGESPAEDAGDDAKPTGEPEFAFGVMTGDRPDAEKLNRKRFRIALMGDFSGRAARGQLETGDALAKRKAILLDPDTVEDVIEGFGTTLVLPIGKEGAGVEVNLGGLDDLHPDELYENVPILSDLQGLRAQLANGSTAANAAQRLKAWGEAHGTPVAPPKTRSAGNAVPANLKLSDFQQLIGDTAAELTTASPVEDMIAQIVGPHVRAVADADTVAMQEAVDEALSTAVRLILHHPEFQSTEAQWRSLDLIARSIETDDTLEVMLYDISAEEIGADLAAAEDLTQSGIVRLLTEAPLDPENGRGGYSAIIGLFTFEETPPHAELLGRIARVAAHVDAPFVAALSPTFMDTAKEDRHPLVATAWDTLRAMPEAGYLGLAAPRFLLRRPYGAKSEPIYEFDFEEFTMSAGLRGMLWANPVVLVAILLAKSYRQNGAHLGLGSIMSLGDMPYHFVTDQYGDQVALPCTERNLTLEKVEKVMARGVMPVVSIKGRDEIRLASFQSLAGGDILGPWSDVPPPPPSPPKPAPVAAPEPAGDTAEAEDDDLGLDDLLAGFDDTATPDADPGDVDADLAALLEDL